MTVLVTIGCSDKIYCWEDLSQEQKVKITKKLNKQTADALGYREVKGDNNIQPKKVKEVLKIEKSPGIGNV